MGHLGYLKTHHLLSQSYLWAGMQEAVKMYVSTCDGCQGTSHA
jgi:hypothetical protein